MKEKNYEPDFEDEEDDDENQEGIYIDGESSEEEKGQEEVVPAILGPEPIFTGLYTPSGRPIFRHPVAVKMGFHPKSKSYHCPTLDGHMVDRVVGWVYDA